MSVGGVRASSGAGVLDDEVVDKMQILLNSKKVRGYVKEAVRCENDEGNRRIWWSWFDRRESDKGRKFTRRWIWRPGSRRKRRKSDHRSHGRAEEVLQRKEE
ncbi:hypothetical protein YC2023_108906 [Brassica napus]